MPTTPPWFALATSVPPPNWTDPDKWQEMTPGERLAAWVDHRNTQPKENQK